MFHHRLSTVSYHFLTLFVPPPHPPIFTTGNMPASEIGFVVRSLNKCPTEAELKEILKKVRINHTFWFSDMTYTGNVLTQMYHDRWDVAIQSRSMNLLTLWVTR